jgi:glycosyltransferase involved in cell wall biosynthesis
MRIAYYCLETPREGQASFSHSKEMVAGLKDQGVAVDYYAPDHEDGWQRPRLWYRVLICLWLQLKTMPALAKCDAVYVRSHPLAFPVSLYCKLRGIPTIQEVNGTTQDVFIVYPVAKHVGMLIEALAMSQYRWAAGLVAVTPGLADWLKAELGNAARKVVVISNGANVELFNSRRKAAQPLREPYVVFVGAQAPWHDIGVLLDALEQPAWPADVTLVLVGDCVNAPSVEVALSSRPNLVAIGHLPYEEVGGVLARAMAAVIPIANPDDRSSCVGVAPIKLYEALACGVPVIVSDLPFQSTLVKEAGVGLIFPPGDAAELAASVAAIAEDRQRFSDRSRAFAETFPAEHSWQVRARALFRFLGEVLDGVRPGWRGRGET